jgi:hypothetical protein
MNPPNVKHNNRNFAERLIKLEGMQGQLPHKITSYRHSHAEHQSNKRRRYVKFFALLHVSGKK